MILNKGLNNLWPTPVLYDKIEPSVYEKVLNQAMQMDLSLPPSDFENGWYNDHLKVLEGTVILPMMDSYMKEAFGVSVYDYKSWRMKKWLTGSHPTHQTGYAMQPHNHMGAKISAVLYLLAEGDETGSIVFVDPRTNANRGYDEHFSKHFDFLKHEPKSGDIVIFPSFLWHYVYPTFSNLRLAMPMDLYLYE